MTQTSLIPLPDPPSASSQQARARLEVLYRRRRGDDDPDVLSLRREFRLLYAKEVMPQVLAESPPFTPEQQDRIRMILNGGGVA